MASYHPTDEKRENFARTLLREKKHLTKKSSCERDKNGPPNTQRTKKEKKQKERSQKGTQKKPCTLSVRNIYKSGQACAVVRFASQLAFHSMPKSLCFLLSFIVLLFVRGESFVKFISSNTTDTKWNDDDTHTPNKSSFLPFFFIFFSAFSLQIKQFWEFSLQVFAFHCVLCLHRIQSQKLRDPATSTSCISPSDLTFNFWASNRFCGCVCVGRFSLNRVHLHRSVFEVD